MTSSHWDPLSNQLQESVLYLYCEAGVASQAFLIFQKVTSLISSST